MNQYLPSSLRAGRDDDACAGNCEVNSGGRHSNHVRLILACQQIAPGGVGENPIDFVNRSKPRHERRERRRAARLVSSPRLRQ